MTNNKLPKPTDEQRVILESKSQCKLIIAVPGSGKSTLLFQAIQQHYARKDVTDHCLLLTFSKKSDNDNKHKRDCFFSAKQDLIEIRTFDSFCGRTLKANWREAGYSKEPTFDNDLNIDLLKEVHGSIKHKYKARFPYEAVEHILSKSNNTDARLKGNLAKFKNGAYSQRHEGFKRIKARYSQLKKQRAIIDFDSQVTGCYRLLKNDPEVLEKIASKYSLILIDEIQDLSPTQLKIAILLAQCATKSILVGDDAQSIYSFRGVKGTNFETLANTVAHAQTFNLTQTHRCTKPVALLASMIRSQINGVSHIDMWSDKEGDKPIFVGFKNHDAQYNYVADQIIQFHDQGIAYSDIAIISRKHESLALVQRDLQVRNIKFNTKYYTGAEGLASELEAVVNLLKLLKGVGEPEANDDVVLNIFRFLGIDPSNDCFNYVYKELESRNKTSRRNDVKVLNSLGNLIRKVSNTKSLEATTKFINEFIVRRLENSVELFTYSAPLFQFIKRIRYLKSLRWRL